MYYRTVLPLLVACIFSFTVITVKAQVTAAADSLMAAGEFSAAAASYSGLLSDSSKLKKLDKGNAFMRRGNCLVNLEKFKEASADYFSALRVFEETKNDERICTAFGNIANAYDKLNEINSAEKYYGKALAISIKMKDATRTGDLLNDRAVILYKQGNKEEAIKVHQDALVNYKEYLSEETLCKHYINLGNCYAESTPDSSLYCYRKAEVIAQNLEDSFSLTHIYLNIGDLAKEKRNFKEALYYLEKSLDMNADYGDSTDLSILYHNLADVYDSLCNYERAYYFSKKERELNEVLYSLEKTRFATELSGKYESDKKDEKIRTQETENKLKSRNLLLSLAGLALAAALGIISFISYKRKQKANLVLQQQNVHIEKLNEELEASNQVKSKLFSVISHDLRGPVSSMYAYLQMQQQTESNAQFSQQTEKLLDTLEDLLVWSKSQLHQFTAVHEKVLLKPLVDQVAGLLQTQAREKKLELQNRIQSSLYLNTDLNMITIIIRNIFSNCIRYSVPATVITVNAEARHSDIILTVINKADPSRLTAFTNRQSNTVSSDASGLGITLIKEFVQKLNGTVDYIIRIDEVSTIISIPSV